MKLSTKGRYAVMAMTDLAGHADRRAVSLAEIAERAMHVEGAIAHAELYTAVNIYLLLGLLWAAIYLAIDAFSPGAIRMGSDPADRQTELLYFSLITLSTVGYGDIVPLSGTARILTALEGVTGVLYIATTVALLVGRFKNESWGTSAPDEDRRNS